MTIPLVLLLAPLFPLTDVVPSHHRIEAELAAPAGVEALGTALAAALGRVAAGAPGPSGGRVLVWRSAGGAWSLEAQLSPVDGAAGDGFGAALAFDGATLAVGAPERDAGRGAVYVFTRSGSAWTQRVKLAPAELAPGDGFGAALALDGSMLAVGCAGDDAAAPDAGRVRVFAGLGATWNELAALSASDASAGARFGASLALDRATLDAPVTLLVGAPGVNAGAGRAHVFVGDGASWSEQATLAAPSPAAGDLFGASVGLAGGAALVGAPGTAQARGAAWGFLRDAGSWGSGTALDASWFLPGDRYGASVELLTDSVYRARALIGAPAERGAARGPGQLSVVLLLQDGSWYGLGGPGYGPPDGRENDAYGAAVAVLPDPAGAAPLYLSGAPDHVEGTSGGALFVHVSDAPALARCFGGLTAACPCGNTGASFRGCDNAAGTGGVRLDALSYERDGSGAGRAGFVAWGFPPAERPTAVLLESASVAGTGAPFGDGILCLGASPARVAAALAEDGRAFVALQHAAPGGLFAYQVLYRSGPASFCDPAAAFNSSNAIELGW